MGSGSRCVECSADGAVSSAATNPAVWAAILVLLSAGVGTILFIVGAVVLRRRKSLVSSIEKAADGLSKATVVATNIEHVTDEITELKDRVMSKIKVIIAFFQIAGTFRVTFNIPYPVAYTRFMSSMSGVVDVNMPRIMGLRCVVNYSYMSSVLVQTAGPLIAEVLLGVVVLPMLILGSRNIKVFKKLGNWGVSVRDEVEWRALVHCI